MHTPTNIQAIGNEIAIVWDDGEETFFPMELLRAASPSAETRGEPDVLGRVFGASNQTEFPGVTVTRWLPVGGYALQFHFSDGHQTGLYSFDYLRGLAEAMKKDAGDGDR
ncbi:MAG: DUF971 domain-containing protein [Verrucomicrobiota bacterium]